MKWLWITALLFLVTGVKSGPPRKVGVVVDGTIDKIARTAKGGAGTSDEFQFTLSGAPKNDEKMLLLEVYADGIKEEPVEANGTTDVLTPTFVANLTQYSGLEATFLITAIDERDDDIAQAHADLKPFPTEGNITRIDRTVKGTTRPSDEFQFTLSATPTNDTTRLLLAVSKDGIPEEPVYAKEEPPNQTPTFVAELTKYSGEIVNFLIFATKEGGEVTSFATADLTTFPNFPGNTTTQNLFDPRDTDIKKILLRVEGSLGDMRPKTAESLIIGDINYFGFPNISSVDYLPWKSSNGVDVYDKGLNTSEPSGTVDDPLVSSAVLAYVSDANAIIKLSPNSDTAEIKEAILIPKSSPPKSSQENVLCTNKESMCTIKWQHPSDKVLQLIIIQKTSDGTGPDAETWATYSFDIHDRELVVTNLGDTILEGRWKILNEEKTYTLTKTNVTNGETNLIEVDCSHLEDMCFGYFPHMTTGKYTLTVAPTTVTDDGHLNQIESLPAVFPAPQPELEILSRHTTTHQNLQKADVKICFQHLTLTEERSFSHYEMLIINEKGQWLKHRIIQEEEEASEERLCFAPFSISTKDFDLTKGTKVVVSQRGVDGVTVLASGESPLF